jgi:site-specific DNA-methyltransferase (adenine-specific)
MSTQAGFALRGRNPDILTCIANLSNDEVFTPPEFANRMLDTLTEAWAESHNGASIWSDKTVRFLDPCTKSGVFLREITSRLAKGLEKQIPNLDKRVDHILTKQVFGIGITEITSLLARRSLYCSKHAKGEHSIANGFSSDDGNIWFQRMEHTWGDSKCVFCGAPRSILDRGADQENYAYAFIHLDDIKTQLTEMFGEKMQFDVIIGNPPYQMKGGAGGSSDSSIFQLFVEKALRLEPRFLSMVMPSRWMAGGRGLDDFRAQMLHSKKVSRLIDFPDSSEAFPGVQIKGGVCYFLWENAHQGGCQVARIVGGEQQIQKNRNLGEFDIFVRDERALGILRKVLTGGEPSVIDLVSGDTPFGIATNFEGWSKLKSNGFITLHVIEKGKRLVGFVERDTIRKNIQWIDTWKVLVPEAYGAGETIPHQILGKAIVSSPPSVCTQSYLVVTPFSSEKAARSFASYYRTRFFRFLVSLRKITQHALRSTYLWVPQQAWNRTWTDELLYEKYGINSKEVEYIESMIRPMGELDE